MTALVPYGKTPQQWAAVVNWAQRRTKYGPSGLSERGLRSVRQHCERIRSKRHLRRETHCRRGHLRTARSVYVWWNSRRQQYERICKVCRDLRRGRPQWVNVPGGRVSVQARDRYYRATVQRLRARLKELHPDKQAVRGRRLTGFTFEKVKRRLDAFLDEQRQAYAAIGLTPPTIRGRMK